MATTRIPPTTPPSGNSSAVGREATLDKSKYQVENLQYPIDLFGGGGGSSGSTNGNQFFNQTYLNYVVFYINVSEQSRVFTDNKVGIVGDVDKSDQNTVQGKNASLGSATAAAGAGGLALGAVLGAGQGLSNGASNNVQNLRGGAGGAARFAAGTLGSAAGGAVRGAVAGGAGAAAAVGAFGLLLEQANPGLKTTKSMKRLKSAIALHVPNEVTVGYRAQYGEEELGAIFGAAAEAATNANVGNIAAGGQGAVNKGMEMNPARNMLSALYKAVPNPRKEQLFKSMEFRRFTMNYQFAPRSPKEAENVKRIINTFKFYMHPEFQNNVNKMLYLFPSEFDIVYYFGDKEHPHLNKISTCVLTDMQVNYSPNGQFATHVDGFPTQINVNMTFLELETLTKERFLGQSPNGQTGSGDYNFENPRLPTF
jgi:hypothetical protein